MMAFNRCDYYLIIKYFFINKRKRHRDFYSIETKSKSLNMI